MTIQQYNKTTIQQYNNTTIQQYNKQEQATRLVPDTGAVFSVNCLPFLKCIHKIKVGWQRFAMCTVQILHVFYSFFAFGPNCAVVVALANAFRSIFVRDVLGPAFRGFRREETFK